MMMNLMVVLLSAAFFVYTNGIDMIEGVNLNKIQAEGPVDDAKTVLDIMQLHFDHSLDYLYTGIQYGSQDGERPGLAKKLRGMSDAQWEAGMAALNKYLEHGGPTDQTFVNKLNFKGEQRANLTKNINSQHYIDTITTLYEDTQKMLGLYSNVYSTAIPNNGDIAASDVIDIAHYIEEKIEKEIEHRHQLKGHLTNLEAMKGIGAAVALFDNNL